MVWRTLSLIILLWSVTGCLSPLAMHRAVIEYDRTVNQVESEMLLLNIARAKQGYPLHFTAISNVAATFDFRSTGGFGGQLFENSGPVFAKNFFFFNFGASVGENPTVSIVPVQGEDFTKRILTPMDETKLDFLLAQGVEPAIVLRLMGRGLAVESDGNRTFYLNLPHRAEEYREFRTRILHLSALNLARRLQVGPIIYEEVWPLPLDHPLSGQALNKGYGWSRNQSGQAQLTRRVSGRVVITNYELGVLDNEERRRLQQQADRYPRNYVFVDIRSNYPGGEFPWRGQVKLRSFNAMLEFLARGIVDELEFDVDADPRSGPVSFNPIQTLAITESDGYPSEAVFAAKLEGRWYAIVSEQKNKREDERKVRPWSHQAFSLLNQLYQMTVTDVARVPTLPITISK